MENQVQEFQRQAVSLAEWDKKIIKNAERVGKLNNKVSEIEQLQRDVEQGISYVTAQQAELEALLDGIDRELPKMNAALGKTPLAGTDAERNKTFELAESVQVQINDVSQQLSRMVEQINTASVAATEAPSEGMTAVAQILNNHMEVLAWIEQQVSNLQRSTLETQKLSERAHTEHERLALHKSFK